MIKRQRSSKSYGLRLIGCLRRSFPTAGLEVLAHTLPLHLNVEELAAEGFLRTKDCEKYAEEEMDTSHKTKVLHRFAIKQLLNDTIHKIYFNNTNYSDVGFDKITKQYMWDKKFHFDTYSWSCLNERKGIPRIDSDANIYTDGSKQDDGRAGAGMAVLVPKTNRTGEYHIHKDKWHLEESTIFQCEVYAIKKAAEWLHSNCVTKNIKEAVINCDSQAAIKALQANVTTSTLVKETVFSLNNLAQFIKVTIRWVKAHVEDSVAHKGNIMADTLAKKGARLTRAPRVPDLPKIPLSILDSKIHKRMMALWKNEWVQNLNTKCQHFETCKQSKRSPK